MTHMHRISNALMIRTYGSPVAKLVLFTAICISATQGQQNAQLPSMSTTSASYAVANIPPAPGMNDQPPIMRPAPSLIIRGLIQAEIDFQKTAIRYSFKRDVVLQTIGENGEVTGQYIRNSIVVLDDEGNRIEKVLYHPKSTITALRITKEDIQDLAGSQLLGMDAADLSGYNFILQGEDNLNGKSVYLVRVEPKERPDPHNMRVRFFVGLIWIDKSTYQILKLSGTTEPHGKQRFPAFQTTRDLRLENLLFPSSTTADDVLRFPRQNVRYRITVKYYNFKRFASRLRIVEVDP